ncbi:MAG: exodeoxyribonuclease VII small subunit [Gammaproteobacteria bacterium]|nr:exodeoxyribonuclease VII small subunit [Gammaproteobacteria bacterium]
MDSNKKPDEFKCKISEVEKIVAAFEKNNMPLNESLRLFETGISLIRNCQQLLDEAEQKITIISDQKTNQHE